MMKSVLFIACVCLAGIVSASEQTCPSYKRHMAEIIEKSQVIALRQAFKTMNGGNRAQRILHLAPIEDTVWPEISSVKMLLSLSKPLVGHIEQTDMWPENNNVRTSTPGASDLFSPTTSYHGGIRYVYNCALLQEKSCFEKKCEYDPNKPVIMLKKHEEVYVPLENFIAANGDAMKPHLVEIVNSKSYLINGFTKMSVRECSARQVFFNVTDSLSDCFESLKFFSLPEFVEARSKPEDEAAYDNSRKKHVEPRQRVYVKRGFFAVMS